MKNIEWFLLILPLFVSGQNSGYPPETILADVHGDTLFLHEENVVRNCGALYQMKVRLQSDTLYWLQEDKGVVFGCDCIFNLAVTVDSMPTGQFIAAAWYTAEPYPSPYCDTVLVGTTPFTVWQVNPNTGLHKAGQAQSDCQGTPTFTRDRRRASGISVYPDPATDRIRITVKDPSAKIIRIYDLQGRCLSEFTTLNKTSIVDVSHYPSGIYILAVTGNTAAYREKFSRK